MVGRTLAHFEIVAKIGEGGMGMVYKARDTRLDRFAAIKVLTGDAITDADRRRRLRSESEAAPSTSGTCASRPKDVPGK